MAGKVPSRSRDQQVVCAGKDSEACSLSIPVAAIIAMLSSIPAWP